MAPILSILCALACLGSEPALTTFTLKNGIRVSVFQVKDAPRQSTFTFLSLGLLNEQAGKPQFTHLLEHLLIRATDPQNLSVEGIQLNGETTGLTLRLETLALPAKWEESLERHVRWLQVRKVDPTTLDREKQAIAGEEAFTVKSGLTHKWALVAWNQAMNHGQRKIRLHGAVASATVADAEAFMKRHLRIDSSVHMATIGPATAAEIRKKLEAEFKTVTALPVAAIPQPESRPVSPRGDVNASWDLAINGMVLGFPFPAGTQAERVAGYCIAQALSQSLQRDEALAKLDVRALAVSELSLGGHGFLGVTASFRTATDAPRVRQLLEAAITAVGKSPWVRLALANSLQSGALGWSRLPDFAAQRTRLPKQQLAYVEGQLFLSRLHLGTILGGEAEAIAAAYQSLDVDQVVALARKHLVAGSARALVLIGEK